MNLPKNQLTGRIAEIEVEHMFASWGWNVGHDHIDDGYDLFIEPDRENYKGARFLVQVKGTARKKGKAIVAQVPKSRLRLYADSPITVVIVRATADGKLYWIHAQDWASRNIHRLSGDGTGGVRFEEANDLSNREDFEAFLKRVLEAPSRRAGALAELAEQRSRYLSSIDARLRVRTSLKDGREQHEVSATADEVIATFQFQPTPEAENIDALRDTVYFGLPREVQVDAFRMTGSPLFEALGADAQSPAKLSVRAATKHDGFVEMRSGKSYSIFAPSLSIPAELYRGNKGAGISNQELPSIFDLSMRLSGENGAMSANMTIGFRPGILSSKPIQYLAGASDFVRWAEAVISDQSVSLELAFRGVRARQTVPPTSIELMRAFLLWARIVGMLHLISAALNSSFQLPEGYEITASEVSDIEFAFALLKGERLPVNPGPIEFETNQSEQLHREGEFLITTTILFSIGGQPLGGIPVRIELPGFVLQERSAPNQLKLSKEEGSQAWISFSEHKPGTNSEAIRRE